jgi:hypothetical protein
MNITDINTRILEGGFTNDQLSSIIDAVKFARARVAEQNKRQLTIGSSVRFTSSKTGVTMRGTVNKIAIKYVTVATQQGFWRVPANMLEVA